MGGGVAFLQFSYAQPVELIVRPVPGAVSEWARTVDRFPAKSAVADPALFESVQAARPVFPSFQEAAKAGTVPSSIPYAFTLSVPDSSAYDVLKARWEGRADVASVEPNAAFTLHARPGASLPRGLLYRPPDPLADSLRHLDVIRARAAWGVTVGDPSIRMGLVDTGLQLDHPDLETQLWVNPGEDLNSNGRVDPGERNGIDDDGNGWVDDLHGYDFVDRPDVVESGDFRDRDADPSADRDGPFSGHATAVAGAMAAARDNGVGITGVAPGSRLVPLRAFGGDGRGATDDIAAAILYAVQAGVDVVNLSFGRDFASPLLEATVQYAVQQGTVVVASAGNNGGDEPHYPSDYPEVVSVAWLNADGTDIAFRGEFGVGIDLGAPGTAIFTTLKPSAGEEATPENLYGRQSGSSMAAPLVAGTVALLRSLDPTLSPASIQSILTASAVDIGPPGWDHRTAAGRLDVAGALARALPARTAIDAPSHLDGTAAATQPITGSAIDPSFASYSVYYAQGAEDLDEGADPWIRLAGPVRQQVLHDTLAVFPAGDFEEGLYTLRLVTTLRSGQSVEDRRRFYVDRTPPRLMFNIVQNGLIGGAYGVVTDLEADDLTTARLRVTLNGQTHTRRSDVRNRRHGIAWPDTRGEGGLADLSITLTNASGLTTRYDTTLNIFRWQANTALFEETTLDVPHGFLLPEATDFDGDGLREITFNQYERGALGDTLRAVEWDGEGFSPLDTLLANVIPRDVGDTNANGRMELLTQVGGATLLLEQRPSGGFPVQEQFVDTTGLQNPGADAAVWGAELTDLDRDNRGEILSHNRTAWRVLEWDGQNYIESARLPNPTGTTGADAAVAANGFQQPHALVADFDADGRTNLLVGDNDGDWIMYEARGDDDLQVVWTHETKRIDAGARFARGDFDDDADTDFVTYTQTLPVLTEGGVREPPIGLYYFWETRGDDAYVLQATLPVQGNSSTEGSMAAADVNSDGRDEVIIAHPPDLYVLRWDEAGQVRVIYHRGTAAGEPGLRSAAMVADDVTGDGRPDLIAGTADESFHLWQFRPSASTQPPPVWAEARAASASAAFLRWRAPQADSVTVWSSRPQTDLDPIAASVDSSLSVSTTEVRRYALQAWYGGIGSPLSSPRSVRPHDPAVVERVSYPSSQSVALRFSEPIEASTGPEQFRLGSGMQPAALLLQRNGHAVVLRFESAPIPREDTLRWRGVSDEEETMVQQTAVPVAFPLPPSDEAFIVEDWEVQGRQTVALTFSAPLDPQEVNAPGRYRLAPRGKVSDIQFDENEPHRLVLRVEDVVFGAVGETVTLRLSGLRSTAGATLSEEGSAIRLVEPATDLSGVYIYPNPHYAQRHDPRITIAGLPAEATVHILSVQGVVVRVLSETGRDGGLHWDLQDRAGQFVPSGVYLVRVASPDQKTVLRKAAIVR